MSSIDEFTKSLIALRYWLLRRERHLARQVQVAHYLRTLHEQVFYPEETIARAFLHDVREDDDVSARNSI